MAKRWARILLFASFLPLMLLVSGCQWPAVDPLPSSVQIGNGRAVVHVVSNGWHSALILAKEDIPPDAIAEVQELGDARYLAFGWGDADFFPDPSPSLWTTLKAGLLPTDAVLHVVALKTDPRGMWPDSEAVMLGLDRGQLSRLIAAIAGTFDRAGNAPAASTEPGIHTSSRFFRAKGRFHVFNTCNTWVARMLDFAGLRLNVTGTILAHDLMTQLERSPYRIQPGP